MIYRYRLVFILFIATTILGSCNLYNPPEQIPSYIHINKIDLTTQPLEGSNSSKITDAWVYVDEQLVGCFELPCTFPVLFEGDHQIMVRAGIKVNGISAIRSPYPFYTSFKQLANLQPGTTVTLSPAVTYASNTTFEFMENFELAGVIIDTTSASDTTLQRIFSPNPEVFEGSSGVAYLDQNNTFFECTSSLSYVLPKGGKDVFLEFNYKSNHEFVVGIIAMPPYYQQLASLTYNASASWNKTYLYLTPNISGAAGATQFKIFIGMHNTNGANDVKLLLDNIKLVY